jgi:hypothetical protein
MNVAQAMVFSIALKPYTGVIHLLTIQLRQGSGQAEWLSQLAPDV